MQNKETKPQTDEKEMAFFDHVSELRRHLIRSIIGIVVGAGLVGIFWNIVQKIIMAPLSSEFFTYKMFNKLGNTVGIGDIYEGDFNVIKSLFNMNVGGQFSAFISVILVGGLIVALPYVVWEMFKFLKPGLTENESKFSTAIIFSIVFFFLMGVGFSYYFVIPLSVHFMFNFTPFEIMNQWTLKSYMTMFVQTILAMGIVFLLPVVIYFLSRLGVVTPQFLKTYRKHAFIVILVLAAFITPSDLLSMFVASLPLLLLYELGIIISKRVYKRMNEEITTENTLTETH